MTYKFHECSHGWRPTLVEVEADLELSIQELQERLLQAQAFKVKFKAGTLDADDTYLSMTIALDNGYDRTGPDFMTVEVVP